MKEFQILLLSFFESALLLDWSKINVHAFWINFVARSKKLVKTSYGNVVNFN